MMAAVIVVAVVMRNYDCPSATLTFWLDALATVASPPFHYHSVWKRGTSQGMRHIQSTIEVQDVAEGNIGREHWASNS